MTDATRTGADALREALAGVAFTTPTPFDPGTNEVRYGALSENVEYLYGEGARLFVPCGNTGEHYALTDEERVGIVETHVEATGPEATVVAGAAGSVPEIRDLASAYAGVGADALMVMHPSHPYVHAEGLAEYYRRICEATELGVLFYKRGPSIPRETLVTIGEREDVFGVKFAVGDVDEFAQSVTAAPDDLTWLAGSAERYALSFAIAFAWTGARPSPSASLASFSVKSPAPRGAVPPGRRSERGARRRQFAGTGVGLVDHDAVVAAVRAAQQSSPYRPGTGSRGRTDPGRPQVYLRSSRSHPGPSRPRRSRPPGRPAFRVTRGRARPTRRRIRDCRSRS